MVLFYFNTALHGQDHVKKPNSDLISFNMLKAILAEVPEKSLD